MYKRKYFFPEARPDDDARIALVDEFFKHDPNFYYLAHTLFLGAEKILNERPGCTFFVWPSMMLFRHAIELMLKSILVDVCGKTPDEVAKHGHDLEGLSHQVLANDNRLSKPVSVKDGQFFREAIKELAGLDPKGDAFRYGLKTTGDRHWKDWPESVNTKKLLESCTKLFYGLRDLHGPPASEKKR